MKRFLFILFMCFFVFCSTVNAEDKNKLNKSEIIEQEYSKCIENSGVLNYPNCAYKYGEDWKKEINKYYNLLKELMTKDEFASLEKSQKSWQQYVEIETELINTFITNQDGVINQTIGNSKIAELYKQRTLFLKNLLFYYQENKFNQ